MFVKVLNDFALVDTTGISYCIMTASTDCPNGGASYMFWINLINSHMGAILTTFTQSPKGEGIVIDYTYGFSIWFHRNSTGDIFLVETGAPEIGEWSHVVIVWQVDASILPAGGVFKVYFDGFSQVVPKPLLWETRGVARSSMQMVIGSYYTDIQTDSPNMEFDELRVFDYPLNNTEILAILNEYN